MQFFSERLKGRRNLLHWSQQRLADECGVSLRSVQGWEKDGVAPHDATLCRLAEVLNVPIAYLTQEDYSPSLRDEGPPYRTGAESYWRARATVAESKLDAIRALLEERPSSADKAAMIHMAEGKAGKSASAPDYSRAASADPAPIVQKPPPS